MESAEERNLFDFLSELIVLAGGVASLAKNSEIGSDVFTEFAMLVEKFVPIFNDLRKKITVMDKPPVRKSLESLESELGRAKVLAKSPNLKQLSKQVEDITHDLGRSLGLLLVASLDVSTDFREKIGALQRQLMNTRFGENMSPYSSSRSEFVSDGKVEGEIEEETINVTIDDVVLQLKHGGHMSPYSSPGSEFVSEVKVEGEIKEDTINVAIDDVVHRLKHGGHMSPYSSPRSEFVTDVKVEGEIEEETINVTTDDVVLQLKHGGHMSPYSSPRSEFVTDVKVEGEEETINVAIDDVVRRLKHGGHMSPYSSPGSEFVTDVKVEGEEETINVAIDDVVRRLKHGGHMSPYSSPGSEFVTDVKVEGEIEEETINFTIDDVVLQLKRGNDEELTVALLGLKEFINGEKVEAGLINEEAVVAILFSRLGSSKADNRLTIIQLLRSIALGSTEKKEKMADTELLSAVVKSLTRDVEERREAVGLLLELSDLPAVRRRIGRIQGCIVMLVAILNGDDPVASHDAAKLLDILSSNNQNALHMAEAGYFKPLVQYLKEGSDMTKILMATALSRLELTDHSKICLGEDGAIEPLVKMFNSGKLESKLSALNALQNLSSLTDNVQRLIKSGIAGSLLQLLFSVTSVLMTLREPASAILARIAQSESILVNQEVAQQMLSLLNLSSPVIQGHLLEALNSIAAHPGASKVRRKMKEKGALQLLLPFLMETNTKIRSKVLHLLHTLSKDLTEELTENLDETHLFNIVNILSSSTSDSEKAAAVGILSNLPVSDKKVTDVLKRANLLPILISIMHSITGSNSPTTSCLVESVAGVIIRFTNSSDKKLQLFSAEHGVIPLLVKLLSSGLPITKCSAATSLTQLSQNSVSLRRSRKSRWLCVPPSADSYCEVHDGYCFVNRTFCLVKAGAVSPLIQILEDKEREAVEAALCALSTLLQDEIWEGGVNCIAKLSGVQAIVKVLEVEDARVQEKALWMLERIFRVEEYRVKYGASAQVILIDLAQKSDSRLKSAVAKVLAQLELLQVQSSYF